MLHQPGGKVSKTQVNMEL